MAACAPGSSSGECLQAPLPRLPSLAGLDDRIQSPLDALIILNFLVDTLDSQGTPPPPEYEQLVGAKDALLYGDTSLLDLNFTSFNLTGPGSRADARSVLFATHMLASLSLSRNGPELHIRSTLLLVSRCWLPTAG